VQVLVYAKSDLDAAYKLATLNSAAIYPHLSRQLRDLGNAGISVEVRS
jgi:hypothetical protein